MKIKFLGASGTVTGSSYVLTSESGTRLLIDLGMFQGPKAIDDLNYQTIDYDFKNLDGAILTHAHLDHCGRLPLSVMGGYKGYFYMTPATRDLTELSLLDTAKIAEQDEKRGLFDKKHAQNTINKFKTVEYHQKFTIGNFQIEFFDAGHILGSASVKITDLSTQEKIIFSGDLGNTPQPLIKPTEYIDSGDYVVIESTYGDKEHEKEDVHEIFAKEINMIEKTSGNLLIPAFSLERSQEILHLIYHLKLEGKINPQTPIYLDSPMAEKATKIFEKYFDLFNEELKKDFATDHPFFFSGMNVVESRQESEYLDIQPGPKVIIAGSGMMSGGRIVSHAANLLNDPMTRLLVVGYQGEETLGREITQGAKVVKIDDNEVTINAQVTHTRSMSSHADQPKLLNWLKQINGVKKVIITHGEDEQRKALSQKISEDLNLHDVHLPSLNDELSW